MSEKRKTINQCLSFTGNMTISELIMSIPSDFRGVVEISEGDLIIADEDVLNFGYKDIRLFNELSLDGNLRQEISDELKNQKKSITLIIFGDFYCENSVLIEHFGLSVRGKAEVFGEDISAESIDITEDLYCRGNITTNGEINVKGDLEVDDGIISSESFINVRGDLRSDCISAYNLAVRGDISFDGSGGIEVQNNVDVRGNLLCSEIEAKNINVQGDLICDSSIKSRGTILVGGDVECFEINALSDVVIRGQADVSDTIEAPHCEVKIGKIAGESLSANCKSLQIG